MRAARAWEAGIMCVSPQVPSGVLRGCPAPASNERGESTTATGRPCLTISTAPKVATASSNPPKLFFASVAVMRLYILAILANIIGQATPRLFGT